MEQSKTEKVLYAFANAYCTMQNAGRQEAKYAATPAVEAAKQAVIDHFGGAAVRGEAVAKCTVPPIGWRCTRIAGHEGPCAAYPIDEAAEKYEAEMLQVIDQRDKYHDMADQLAAQIAAMTEMEIGEHSSDNEPWRNALIAGDEFIAAKFKAFCNGPVSARAADAPSEPSDVAGGTVALASRLRNHAVLFVPWSVPAQDIYAAADALDSQPTERIAELEAQLAECVALSQKWASAAGEADGRAEKLRVALEYYADPKTNAPGSVAREALAASSQPTDGGVRNG